MMRGKIIITGIFAMVVSTFFFSALAAEKKPTQPTDAVSGHGRSRVQETMIRQFENNHEWVNMWSIAHCEVDIDVRDSDGLEYVEIQFRGHRIFRVERPGDAFTRRDLNLDLTSRRPTRSGLYPLTAVVRDMLGNEETKAISLKVDIKEPSFQIKRPHDGAVIYTTGATSDITFEINALDDYSKVERIMMWRKEPGRVFDLHEDATPPYLITFRDIPVGEHEFIIDARDNAGNDERLATSLSGGIRETTISITVRRR